MFTAHLFVSPSKRKLRRRLAVRVSGSEEFESTSRTTELSQRLPSATDAKDIRTTLASAKTGSSVVSVGEITLPKHTVAQHATPVYFVII